MIIRDTRLVLVSVQLLIVVLLDWAKCAVLFRPTSSHWHWTRDGFEGFVKRLVGVEGVWVMKIGVVHHWLLPLQSFYTYLLVRTDSMHDCWSLIIFVYGFGFESLERDGQTRGVITSVLAKGYCVRVSCHELMPRFHPIHPLLSMEFNCSPQPFSRWIEVFIFLLHSEERSSLEECSLSSAW